MRTPTPQRLAQSFSRSFIRELCCWAINNAAPACAATNWASRLRAMGGVLIILAVVIYQGSAAISSVSARKSVAGA